MPVSTADKRATFHKMHESGCFVLPNPYDVGTALALQHLELEPIIDLGMRLGEGTGAAVALPVVRAAIATLASMATFEAAQVTNQVSDELPEQAPDEVSDPVSDPAP